MHSEPEGSLKVSGERPHHVGRVWIAVAALSGLAAVGLGAYGAHGLDADEAVLKQFDTANRYHMWHSLALLGVGLFLNRTGGHGRRLATAAAFLLLLGIGLFSGALYAVTALEFYDLSFLAPWGGMAFMAGWALLAAAAVIRDNPRHPKADR